MSKSTTYPVSTIAKLLLLSERRVQQLVCEGVLPKGDLRGRYELVPVIQGYVSYLQERQTGSELGPSGEHKRRLLKARADIAEREAERMANSLVPVEQVEKTWAEVVSRIRDITLAIAPKVAPMLAVEKSVEACHEIIETYVHEALTEIAATPVESR